MPIRQASAHDAEHIVAIVNAAFEPAERFLYEGPRILVEDIRERLERGSFLLEADAGGPSRACVYVEATDDCGYFGLLAVLPAHQGRGIARQLVAAAEAWCRQRGCHAVEIDVVNHRRELFPFYTRLGYAVVGQRPFANEHLRLPSHFVILRKPLAATKI